jgi:hypothetical protein
MHLELFAIRLFVDIRVPFYFHFLSSEVAQALLKESSTQW